MRFQINKIVYRKRLDDLDASWYSEERYRKYRIYDTKTKKWITTDEFVKIAKEKEIKVK